MGTLPDDDGPPGFGVGKTAAEQRKRKRRKYDDVDADDVSTSRQKLEVPMAVKINNNEPPYEYQLLMQVPQANIGFLIGKGGGTINGFRSTTHANIEAGLSSSHIKHQSRFFSFLSFGFSFLFF